VVRAAPSVEAVLVFLTGSPEMFTLAPSARAATPHRKAKVAATLAAFRIGKIKIAIKQTLVP
jgi:hypothetical protein